MNGKSRTTWFATALARLLTIRVNTQSSFTNWKLPSG